MIMKFNYEFEFDIDDFVEYVEEDYFDDDIEYDERTNKAWLEDRLYYYVDGCDFPLTIIQNDLKCFRGKNIYCQKIIDTTYEILENKRAKLEEEKGKEKEEIMEHLRFITDYCEKQCNCIDCPMYEICDGTIGDLRIKSNR